MLLFFRILTKYMKTYREISRPPYLGVIPPASPPASAADSAWSIRSSQSVSLNMIVFHLMVQERNYCT